MKSQCSCTHRIAEAAKCVNLSCACSNAQVLGHLAAEVAKWLCPLVIGNMVEVAGTVQDEPSSASSPITVNVQVQSAEGCLEVSFRAAVSYLMLFSC